MTRAEIVALLVQEGERLLKAPKSLIVFIGDEDSDRLLNDLDGHPHAFVLACVMDRQIKAKRAWMIPYLFSQKLGGFGFATLQELSLARVTELMTEPEPLHRFPTRMSENFYLAVQRIAHDYRGNASQIWANQPSSAEVVYRFLQFHGVGRKIATMAANILAREFKVPFADYYSIDVSVDVQVRRVFTRLGLARAEDDVEEITYLARAFHPVFPGLLDFPAWEIGVKWCRPQNPTCNQCMMRKVCPPATDGSAARAGP